MAAVAPVTSAPLPGLARSLMQAGRLNMQQADHLNRKAIAEKHSFIHVLLNEALIDSTALAQFCSETFGYPLLDFSAFNLGSLPERIIDPKLMQSQHVVALCKRGNKLSVGISDPTNIQALEQIKFQTELNVEPVILDHKVLLRLLEKLGQSAEQNLKELIGDDLENINFIEEDTVSAADAGTTEVDDAPIVRFLQKILIDAINMGASDLHFEPFEKHYQIRFRIDGVLQEIAQPPLAIKEKLASRI